MSWVPVDCIFYYNLIYPWSFKSLRQKKLGKVEAGTKGGFSVSNTSGKRWLKISTKLRAPEAEQEQEQSPSGQRVIVGFPAV